MGSILREIDGFIRWETPAENRAVVTFDDAKTDAAAIRRIVESRWHRLPNTPRYGP